MKTLITILLLFFTIEANSQTLSFSPTSVPLWGSIEKTMKASVEYKGFEFVAVKAMQTMYDYHGIREMYDNIQPKDTVFERPGVYSGYYFGLFYSPLTVEYGNLSANAGVGIWNRRFPTKNGQLVHFTVSLSYQIHEHFSLSYEHKSNGMGIITKLNPGADWFSIKYHF